MSSAVQPAPSPAQGAPVVATHVPASSASEDVWSELKPDLFGERRILDGADLLAMEAPYRPHGVKGLGPVRARRR